MYGTQHSRPGAGPTTHPALAGASMRPRGFTLIELLVVIAIIALLLAILAPSFPGIQENIRRKLCAHNLRQYGIGILGYRSDNKNTIMQMVRPWGSRPYPDYIRFESTPAMPDEWSINLIDPYIAAHSMSNQIVEGIGMCPSVDVDVMNDWIKYRNYASHNFLEFPYTYWGRIDLVADSQVRGPAKDELMGRQLDPGRILMSDIINYDHSSRAYRYNHSPNGWAYNENWRGMPPRDYGPDPLLSGINRLYGGGAVIWRKREQFDNLDKMCSPGSYPDGAVSHGDTFYY